MRAARATAGYRTLLAWRRQSVFQAYGQSWRGFSAAFNLSEAQQTSNGCEQSSSPFRVLDPGRFSVVLEFASGMGRELLHIPLDNGGSVYVTAHDVVEPDNLRPSWMVENSRQEWRVLRFQPSEGTSNLIQSVAKVCIAPAGSCEPLERQRGDCLALAYTKTHVAVILATLQALGAPVVPRGFSPSLKILCIGLGGGSVPSFLTETLPHCEVDVAELEPAVLLAASRAMGFVQSPRLSVTLQDGVSFAKHAIARSVDPDGVYDAVLIDAYDAAGNVPEALWSRDTGIACTLGKGLLKRHGVIATNFLPDADVSSALDAYSAALVSCDGEAGVGFHVQGEGYGNLIAVQTRGQLERRSSVALQDVLRRSARQVQGYLACPFDFEQLAVRNLQIIPPDWNRVGTGVIALGWN